MPNHHCSVLIVAVEFLQPGHNSSETQIHRLQVIQLAVCAVQECKASLFLADFISQSRPLPFYCNPHSQVFDGKTQNRASQLLQTVVTLIFLSFSFSSFHYFPLFSGLLSACSLLCCSSSASHQRDTIMPMEKCFCEYISSPCLQECVSE